MFFTDKSSDKQGRSKEGLNEEEGPSAASRAPSSLSPAILLQARSPPPGCAPAGGLSSSWHKGRGPEDCHTQMVVGLHDGWGMGACNDITRAGTAPGAPEHELEGQVLCPSALGVFQGCHRGTAFSRPGFGQSSQSRQVLSAAGTTGRWHTQQDLARFSPKYKEVLIACRPQRREHYYLPGHSELRNQGKSRPRL